MNQETDNPTPDAPDVTGATGAVAAELAEVQKDLAAQKDLHLRLAADFDNFKRRTRQASEGLAAAQKEAFVADLLPVIDSLERALASGASADSRQFHQGVELTLQQLRQLLRQHGFEIQESVGRRFDPHQHEALALRCDPAYPDHTILEDFQRGYLRGGNVFRPAKVVVNDLTHSPQPAHVR